MFNTLKKEGEMAKMSVVQIYSACGTALRVRLNHTNDDVGKMALNAYRILTTFLGSCSDEIEIPPEVEEAIRNVRSVS